jgi:hypothetical protein
MKFNICIVRPEGYVHSLAFLELAELLLWSLRELGHDAQSGFNGIRADSRNILIGCHLLGPEAIARVPRSTVVLNTEQIDEALPTTPAILAWARQFEVWDYSERNLATFARLGVPGAKRLRLGFQKELVRIPKREPRDIDVLFYGAVNDRRRRVVEALRARGLAARHVFGAYGEVRDRLIGASKVVLNLHYYDTQIFEVIRVFYLLTNAVAVVAEVNASTSIDPAYRDGTRAVPYEGLVDACVEAVATRAWRDLEGRGFAAISRQPQAPLTAALL